MSRVRTEEPLLAITPYGADGASSRVRVFDWVRYLKLEVELVSYLDTGNHAARTMAKNLHRIPFVELGLRALSRQVSQRCVLISRLASPFSNGGLECRLLRSAGWGVYDFDDALWAGIRTGMSSVFSKERIWRHSVSAADRVIAGSEYLAEEASRFNRDVVEIPSCVDPAQYMPKMSYAIGDRPELVWLGSPTTEAYLQFIKRPLLELHRRRGVVLKLISGGNRPLGQLAAMTTRVPWKEGTFGAELAGSDIGIAPLRDDEFSRGKCAYKVLQYGASALPIVGSPVGANRRVLAGLRGLAPSREDDWVSAIEELLDEGEIAREVRGKAALGAVQAKYSYSAWTNRWLDCLDITRDP